MITVYRQEVRPFTEGTGRPADEFCRAGGHRHRERAAAQRIAPAYDDLAESLEQQTATSEVLEASSARRPASWSRYSRPCWRTRRASAMPSSARCSASTARTLTPRQLSGRRRNLSNSKGGVGPISQYAGSLLERVIRTRQATHTADRRAEPASSPTAAARRRAIPSWPCRCSRTTSDRCNHYLPPGSPALHRQADRAGAELRRPGRHRHREHAAAQ